ncbi:MAG: hypothetical protein M3O46_07190 [Myxococcota bacterium]|nr:hypothetical protein [Myxococcota bacterium]
MTDTPERADSRESADGGFHPPKPRTLLGLGGVLTVLGLLVAATTPVLGAPGSDRTPGQQLAGGVVVLIGWVFLAWGIHRFGRET